MNEPVLDSKKPCCILLIIAIIIFDLTTFAFSIVIFAKVNALFSPKKIGFIAIFAIPIYLCFLILFMGFWVHLIIVALTYILSKYRNDFKSRLISRAIALVLIGIVSCWFGYGAIRYYAIIPPCSYIIALVLDIVRVKYYSKNQEDNTNNYNQI